MNEIKEFEDRLLSLGLSRVSEAAALAASKLIGMGDEKKADQAAVDAMRKELNKLNIDGTIVIGEGERDEAPMLYIGEKVGTGKGPQVDIALDPLEGTTLTAKDMPNALAVIAMGPKNSLLNAPDVYMEKLAIGAGYPKNIIDLDMSPSEIVKEISSFKKCSLSEIKVCVLERPRHDKLIEELRESGVKICLITDGDVAGVIHCAEADKTGIDIYMGQGGAPEGVLAAAALKCLGGQFQGRLIFRTEDEKERARKVGLENLKKKYELNDLVKSDVIFAATGVTDGSMVSGIRFKRNTIEAETLLMRSKTRSIRYLKYKQNLS